MWMSVQYLYVLLFFIVNWFLLVSFFSLRFVEGFEDAKYSIPEKRAKKILCTNEFYQYSIRCVSTVLWFLNIHLTSVSISSHKYSCERWVLSICRYFKKVHRPPQQWLHFDYSFFAMHTQCVRMLPKWAIFHVFFLLTWLNSNLNEKRIALLFLCFTDPIDWNSIARSCKKWIISFYWFIHFVFFLSWDMFVSFWVA